MIHQEEAAEVSFNVNKRSQHFDTSSSSRFNVRGIRELRGLRRGKLMEEFEGIDPSTVQIVSNIFDGLEVNFLL